MPLAAEFNPPSKVASSEFPDPNPMSFTSLGLDPAFLKVLSEEGYAGPTPSSKRRSPR